MDTPHIRDMMRIAHDDGVYAMQKSVAEHVEKRAVWRDTPGAPRPNKPILADHIVAYNNFRIDDGKYHPEYLYRGRLDDLRKQPLNRSYRIVGTNGRMYVIPAMHVPFLNLSRRNSGNVQGSNGFIDARLRKPSEAYGFSALLDPKRHKVFNNVDDWIDFTKKHPVYVPYEGEEWAFPDFDTYPGVDSIEWTKTYFDHMKTDDARRKLADNMVGHVDELKDEPQIAILNRSAILSTQPYYWADNVNMNSYEKNKNVNFTKL